MLSLKPCCNNLKDSLISFSRTDMDSPEKIVETSVSKSGRAIQKRGNSSWVWKHFVKCKEKNGIICTICASDKNKKVKPYSLTTGTSSLSHHLRGVHKILSSESADPNQAQIVPHGFEFPSFLSDSERASILHHLVKFIVDSKSPFSIVKSFSFKQFCTALNNRYQLPSPQTIVRAISDEHLKMQAKFRKNLQAAPGKISLTADGWSSRTMRGYFVVTAHWIDVDWTLQHSILRFIYFPRPHNSSTTATLLTQIIHQYGIESKIVAITTDSGSEMKPAMDLVKTSITNEGHFLHSHWHIRCVCHIINRAIQESEKAFSNQVAKIRELIKKIRLSPGLRECFKPMQAALGCNQDQVCDVPGLDVETRWNSMYLMISSAIKLRSVFDSMCSHPDHGKILSSFKLTSSEWDSLESVTNFLHNAFKFTQAASGSSYFNLSFSPMIYDALKSQSLSVIKINAAESSTGSSPTRKAAKVLFEKLSKYKFTLKEGYAVIAQIIDPRISNASISEEEKDEFRSLLSSNYGFQVRKPSNTIGKLSSGIDELIDAARTARNEVKTTSDEISDFFKLTESEDPSCVDVVEWWAKTGRVRFPHISLLARDVLCIMGSSVPSESAFSDAGGIVSSTRSSLSDDNIAKSMELRSWYKLLE